MKKLTVLLITALFVFTSVAVTVAGDKKDKDGLKFWAGYVERDFNDSLATAGEYQPEDSSVAFGLKYIGMMGNTFLSAYGWFSHEDNMFAELNIDFNRIFKVDASYERMTHNLLHDTLTNLQAVEAPKVTYFTDYDPDSQYSIVRSQLKTDAELKVPSIPWLTVETGFRMEKREGTKQGLTMSHCQNCHITSRDREIDQTTSDFKVKGAVNSGAFTAVYSFLARDFEEGAATLTQVYQDAIHPGTGADVFTNRAAWDADDGELPYAMVNDSKKTTHNVKMQYRLSKKAAVQGAFIMSNIENSYTGNEADFSAYSGKVTLGLGKNAKLSVRGKYTKIESDDYFVDTPEPTAVAGPHAGKTYRELYGFDPDWTRMSAMDRENLRLDAKFYFVPFKKSSLALDYMYHSQDRDNYYVTESETDTVTNRFKLRFNTRALKKAMISLSYEMDLISRPFVNVNGACTPDLEGGTAPSPLSPLSIQYYELNDSKIADISNMPSQKNIFKAKVNWHPSPKFSMNANFRWNASKNDELDYSEWSGDILMGNLNLNWTPSPKFYTTVSYVYHMEKDETMFCVPVFDG